MALGTANVPGTASTDLTAVKSTADNALSKAEANAKEISNVKSSVENALKAAGDAQTAASSVKVTRVKGNSETTFRDGDVNITPQDVGALPINGGTMTGALVAHSNNDYATAQTRNVIISASAPSGSAPDGTVWYQYE